MPHLKWALLKLAANTSTLKAEVIVAQFAQRTFEAEFLTIAKGFDPATQTVLAEFIIENEDRSLWPGSYATVNMTALVRNASRGSDSRRQYN